jgi:hypothetical protein
VRWEGLWCGDGTQEACTGVGPTQGLGAKGTRGAHAEHATHVRDPGGVPAQRLVERVRELRRRGEGMRCGGGEVRAGRREGPWGGGGTQEACTEMARLKAWGPRARAERTPNMVFMSVTLEVSKLSGWLKADALCRVEGEGMRCGGGEVRAGRREGLWCGGGTQEACTRKGPTQGLGAKGTRGAHGEHVVHVRDAGGVPAQRLVEGRRGLPSRRGGHAMRGGEV